ncbi:MAG: hypothetical protein HY243_00300 [Proteobacteria bacterium]|nr:hypothetical protein [Pseudomonadota bacterium]
MDAELASVFTRGLEAKADLTEVELIQFHAMARDWLSFHSECLWLSARGMLDEDGHMQANGSLRVLLRFPGFRAAWRLSRIPFSKAYGAFIDAESRAAIAQGQPLSYLESWKAALAAEENGGIR